ncbi:hypothetical protein C0216_16495 [Streptomyces globosus]|uniref:Uncharacterized protein n=1 Tax=Streptomyces globosus TaxID=68209 RepID=A0A344U1R5_9ACTN|nr:hypothetical protein [Streptomyces globosus]AXE24836.1 hypothetical protein C0216_16495 [Streptomyces globosus]
MNPAGEGPLHLDAVSVLNAKTTLVRLLGRAGIHPGDAEELIGLVSAGAVAVAAAEVAGRAEDAPTAEGGPYASGWLDGARTVTGALGGIAERMLRDAVGADAPGDPLDARPPAGRMELERAKVAVLPLYLSFAPESDLDPDVSEPVLTAVLGTMTTRQRTGYAGRLTAFAAEHRARLERMYAQYGPGSPIAIHGRYSLLHSPTSVAVLERLLTEPAALREEWDAAELPPAWLEGLTTAWGPSA